MVLRFHKRLYELCRMRRTWFCLFSIAQQLLLPVIQYRPNNAKHRPGNAIPDTSSNQGRLAPLESFLMRRLWSNYNLSIVLTILFVVSWAIQTWTGWVHFQAEQMEHGETAEWFGPSGYIWEWAAATFENWQSEFLQLLTFVVLTSFLIHRGSHESKDSDEEMMATLERIEQRLANLEASGQLRSR